MVADDAQGGTEPLAKWSIVPGDLALDWYIIPGVLHPIHLIPPQSIPLESSVASGLHLGWMQAPQAAHS